MAAIFRTNQPTSGKTTIQFTWFADTAKTQQIVSNAVQLLYNRGLGLVDGNGVQIPFASLSNQQKLNIVDGYILDTIVGLARQWRVDLAANTARDGVLTTPGEDEFDG